METTFRNHIGYFAQALSLRQERSEMLASNIANAATPGFKARDIDFQAAFAARTGQGAMAASDKRHFTHGADRVLGPGYRMQMTPSLDGNTVELAVEQMEFAENSLRYQMSLNFLNRRIGSAMGAMREE